MQNGLLTPRAELGLDPQGRPATLWGMLARAAEQHPNRDALVMDQLRLTYSDIITRVEGVAHQLVDRGLSRGERLAIWLPNSVDWVIYALAANRLGLTILPVNTRYKTREARAVLTHSGAAGIVYTPQYWNQDYASMLDEISPGIRDASHQVHEDGRSGLPLRFGIAVDASLQQAGAGLGQAAPLDWPQPQEDDDALLMYTSGTTGTPKGVLHTNVLTRNVRNITKGMRAGDGDRFLGHMPLYHIAGLCTGLAAALAVQGTYFVMTDWDPAAAVELIAHERITIVGGIQTHYIDLMEAVEASGADTSSLKTGWIGGANVSADVVHRTLKVLQMDALQSAYGATETTSVTTLTPFEESHDKSPQNIGKVIGDYEVGIFDPQTNEPLPEGESGEVRVRGHIVMKEYLDNEQATREATAPGGWFCTGDIGEFSDGYLSVRGRVKDIYITGGSNVYPAEIEAVIGEMGGVRQVAVIGVADDRLGEVGKALVQLESGAVVTEDDVRAHCKTQLASYKVPRMVVIIDQFPMTASGKIQRAALKDV